MWERFVVGDKCIKRRVVVGVGYVGRSNGFWLGWG